MEEEKPHKGLSTVPGDGHEKSVVMTMAATTIWLSSLLGKQGQTVS